MPTPDDIRPSSTESRCRVCGGNLEPKWRLQVLGRYDADYHECSACGCLQIPAPHWLAEAYKSEGQPVAANPDSGRFCRNFSAYIYLRALNHAGFFGPQPRILDYGGGSGILTAMFRLAGFHCRQYDPFCPLPLLEPELAYTDASQIPAAAFELVTALEVFEHLLDPRDTIRRLASYGGADSTVAITTGLYDSKKHNSAWPYLSCEAGQHITFYARESLRVLADACDMRTVCLFPSDEGFLILFTRHERPQVERRLRQADHHLRSVQLHSQWTVGAWDLLRRLGTPAIRQPFILSSRQ